jgi:glycerophosphoryl diester phosphodiesterase
LPVLYNVGLKGIHRDGPWAADLPPLFLRLDVRPILLDELLDRIGQRCGVLLDLKADGYHIAAAQAFIAAMLATLDARAPLPMLDFCGSWPLLDIIRTLRPEQMAHYSVDSERDWTALQERLAEPDRPRGITIEHGLVDETRAAVLRSGGVEFYCWGVDGADDAQLAIRHGAAGIIADDLDMLAGLDAAAAPPREGA